MASTRKATFFKSHPFAYRLCRDGGGQPLADFGGEVAGDLGGRRRRRPRVGMRIMIQAFRVCRKGTASLGKDAVVDRHYAVIHPLSTS